MTKLVFVRMVVTCNTCQNALATGDMVDPRLVEPKAPSNTPELVLAHNSTTGHMTARVVPELVIVEMSSEGG